MFEWLLVNLLSNVTLLVISFRDFFRGEKLGIDCPRLLFINETLSGDVLVKLY